jgi:hypothetical protein
MCTRHAAHLIAEYEATRLASEENEETSDTSSASGSEQESNEPIDVIATVVARLSR